MIWLRQKPLCAAVTGRPGKTLHNPDAYIYSVRCSGRISEGRFRTWSGIGLSPSPIRYSRKSKGTVLINDSLVYLAL